MVCDYLSGWIQNVTYAKFSLKMVNPRDLSGNAEEDADDEESLIHVI